MIKQNKREHWSSSVEETVTKQDIWQVIRVSRNRFNTRSTMPALLDNNSTDETKAVNHRLLLEFISEEARSHQPLHMPYAQWKA